jgi:hypothetical protein
MNNDNYTEPSKEFFLEQFSHLPFGMLRPSELELLVFYLLAYYRGDLEKSEFEIADSYMISETKAARFKVEISKRFLKGGDTARHERFMRELAEKIFVHRDITLECDAGKIGVPVYNPCYMRALK